jgi:chromosomal replication initiation ATPase DnaA
VTEGVLTPDLVAAVAARNPTRRRPAQHEIVQSVVAAYYDVPFETMLGGGRRALRFVFARHVAMYLLHDAFSLVDIAKFFRAGDHTTVLYGVTKVDRLLAENDALRTDLAIIRDCLARLSKITVTCAHDHRAVLCVDCGEQLDAGAS